MSRNQEGWEKQGAKGALLRFLRAGRSRQGVKRSLWGEDIPAVGSQVGLQPRVAHTDLSNTHMGKLSAPREEPQGVKVLQFCSGAQ